MSKPLTADSLAEIVVETMARALEPVKERLAAIEARSTAPDLDAQARTFVKSLPAGASREERMAAVVGKAIEIATAPLHQRLLDAEKTIDELQEARVKAIARLEWLENLIVERTRHV